MPAFNFQEAFASYVESEAKRQTIRAKRRFLAQQEGGRNG